MRVLVLLYIRIHIYTDHVIKESRFTGMQFLISGNTVIMITLAIEAPFRDAVLSKVRQHVKEPQNRFTEKTSVNYLAMAFGVANEEIVVPTLLLVSMIKNQ